MLETDSIATVQIHAVSERSEISIPKSVRPHLEVNLKFSTEHQSLSGKEQKAIPRDCTAASLWQCLAVLSLFSEAWERTWQCYLHTLRPCQRCWEKAQCCRLTAHGYWADQTTPLQFLFVQICHIPAISSRPSICPCIGNFFRAVINRERLTSSLYTVINTVFSCIQSFCGSNFHFEMAVHPELAVLFFFWGPSL